ncbi:MAG: cytochrome c [Cyclobacteriaceae bacterium]|nr:cytochrome c [Cyclobacteriaceae bacterium]
MRLNHKYLIVFPLALLFSCGAKNDNPGTEFSPNMYHAVPYEPLIQITDEDAGAWVDSDDDSYGEYYSSNPHNPHNMNMRVPPANTVKRTESGWLPYHIPKDSVDMAARLLTNPLDSSEQVIAQGKELYEVFCIACHGATGKGDGLVGKVMLGVAAYNVGRVKDVNEGHIFHVITMGKGRMYPHDSQIEPMDRWKIVRYVQTLQNQPE